MPRKLSSAYVRRLNKEQETARLTPVKHDEKKSYQDSNVSRLKSFMMICQSCGTRAKFTVDGLGYATCNNCRAIANYRLGHLA